MDLIHVTHNPEDRTLTELLKERSRVAAACMLANEIAQKVGEALREHLRQRLRQGVETAVLRKAMLDAGLHATTAAKLLKDAGATSQPAYRTDRRQQHLFADG